MHLLPVYKPLVNWQPVETAQLKHAVLCTAVRPISQNTRERPIPDPKAQGGDPLVHRGKLQHMAAELGSYKQAHTSSPPLAAGNSRIEESPASLKELGSRAQTVRGSEPDYLELVPLNLSWHTISSVFYFPWCGR